MSFVVMAVALGAVLLAGLLTGLAGFGFSVLSVPLLVLVYPPHDVVLIVLFLVPITSLALLLTPRLRGLVRMRLCLQLAGASLLGLPFGLVIFQVLDRAWLSGLMGVVLVTFAVLSLKAPAETRLPTSRWIVPSGVLGGLLATSTGLSGPAVAMYVLHSRNSDHDEVVATMSAYVALVSMLGLTVLLLQGAASSAVVGRVAWLTPVALLGVLLGRWWAKRNVHMMDRVALYAMGLMGLATIVRQLLE